MIIVTVLYNDVSAISNDDGTWRTDVFYNVIGTNYVSLALQAARAADPNAKLYINDYNIEYSGPKLTAMLNLVKQLKAANVPLDGIGLQGHFISGSVPGNIASVLQQFTALGGEVRFQLFIHHYYANTPSKI